MSPAACVSCTVYNVPGTGTDCLDYLVDLTLSLITRTQDMYRCGPGLGTVTRDPCRDSGAAH